MYGILNFEFSLIDARFIEEYEDYLVSGKIEEGLLIMFNKNSKVKVLKEIFSDKYDSGNAYIIMNDEYDVITVDSSFVDLIK